MMPLEVRALLAAIILAGVGGLAWLAYDAIYDRGYAAAEATQAEAERSALIERAVENAKIVQRHEDTTNELKARHAKELADSRARSNAAPGLRVGAAICDGFARPTETESAGRGDGGSAATRLVPPAVDRDFRALEQDIERVFAGCRVAQDFLITHGMAP